MPLLLDTYNIIHVVGVLPPHLAGVDVRGLAELISPSRYGGDERLLVCDGVPASGAPRGVVAGARIVYTGHGRTADEHIMDVVAGSTAPRRLLVVTSDRAIIKEVRKRRCRTIDSETFLAQLAADAELAEDAPGPASREPSESPEAEGSVDPRWQGLIDLGTEYMARESEAPLPPDLAERLPSSRTPAPGTPGSEEAPPPVADVTPVLPEEVLREAGELWQEKSDEEKDERQRG